MENTDYKLQKYSAYGMYAILLGLLILSFLMLYNLHEQGTQVINRSGELGVIFIGMLIFIIEHIFSTLHFPHQKSKRGKIRFIFDLFLMALSIYLMSSMFEFDYNHVDFLYQIIIMDFILMIWSLVILFEYFKMKTRQKYELGRNLRIRSIILITTSITYIILSQLQNLGVNYYIHEQIYFFVVIGITLFLIFHFVISTRKMIK